jgi:MFS family permease
MTFISFLGLFEFGSIICGAARSSNMLIIGRAIAGLGSSGLSNGALTIIGAIAPMHKRPGKALNIYCRLKTKFNI